jgi:hypothetical protein
MTPPSPEPQRVSIEASSMRSRTMSAGSASLFDDLEPGATVAVHVDYISCVKVDEVRAYVEGNGL